MSMKDIELINFIDLSIKEKLIVLQWRNNELTRVWMYNSKIIKEQDHLKFIESLKTNIQQKYFLVKNNAKMIGVIYFTNIKDESAEFGIYSNPMLKGLGKILMSTILKYAFVSLNLKTLHAEVFENNTKALKLYLNNGLQTVLVKNRKNRKIIFMEIKNENK